MPVGLIQPIFQDSSTSKKSKMEKPTRNASAVAMLPFLGRGSPLSLLLGLRIMYTRAAANEPRMATNAKATRIFMNGIIR